jgi:flavin-dependent dehydrogenase
VTGVLIAGGGLAGSAAAIILARAGREVVLVEREAKPQHKVCGEFLSHEALVYLDALGVDAAALGAVPINRVRFSGSGEVPLPFAAMSLTRRRLDEELLRLASSAGAIVERGRRVQAIERASEGWCVRLDDAKSLAAKTVFVATGKHDLPGRARPKGMQPNLVAFKMYWQLTPKQAKQLEGCVELLLYRGGYAGLQPVEDEAANLCCLIQRGELQRLGGWDNLLAAMQYDCPLLRERLDRAQPLLAKPLAIASIPYGYVRGQNDGLWCLGDQAAVIPSFTGDGMSIALHSGCLAADMYLRGETPDSFQQHLRSDVALQVGLATAISRGMIWPPARNVFAAAVSFWPGLLSIVAGKTRIAPKSLCLPA